MRLLFTITLVIGLLAGCIDAQTTPAAKAKPAPYTDAEAYAVYSAAIMQTWPYSTGEAKMLVIQAETDENIAFGGQEAVCIKPSSDEEAIFAPVIAEYKRINAKKWLLSRKFDIGIPYEIVGKATLRATFGPDGFKSFNKRYPNSGGYIRLSAVAFNSDRSIAIVYMAHRCGSPCGSGNYHILQKKDGKWSPAPFKGEVCGWVS